MAQFACRDLQSCVHAGCALDFLSDQVDGFLLDYAFAVDFFQAAALSDILVRAIPADNFSIRITIHIDVYIDISCFAVCKYDAMFQFCAEVAIFGIDNPLNFGAYKRCIIRMDKDSSVIGRGYFVPTHLLTVVRKIA